MDKLLYKPVSVLVSVLGGLLAEHWPGEGSELGKPGKGN